MAISLEALVLQAMISTIIVGPILWIAGRMLVGKQKAKFTDGLAIVALGTTIGTALSYVGLPGWIATIVMLIVWRSLIKYFFDCGWLKALLIAIGATSIFIIIALVLEALGFTAFTSLLPSFPSLL